MIPCIVIFLLLQRYYVAGLTAGAVRLRAGRFPRSRVGVRQGGPGMTRVVVVGATGHIGTYLVPRLVRAGPSRLPCHRPPGCLVSGARASTGLGG